jgi:hypothetical protein
MRKGPGSAYDKWNIYGSLWYLQTLFSLITPSDIGDLATVLFPQTYVTLADFVIFRPFGFLAPSQSFKKYLPLKYFGFERT